MRENTIYYCKMNSVGRHHIGYIEYYVRYSKRINVYNDRNFPLKTNEVFLEKVIYGKNSN